MKNLRIGILFIAVAFFTSSCVNIIEELFLKKDGSGTYALNIDLSGIIDNPMMQGTLEGQDSSSSTDNTNPLGGGLDLLSIDTSFNFLTTAQEKGRTLENPDFWEKVNLIVKSDIDAGEMMMTVHMNFNTLEEITYLYDNLAENFPLDDGADKINSSGMVAAKLAFALKKRKFSRVGRFTSLPEDAMNDEAQNMIKMIFAKSTYQTIYHLPGKVKSTNFPNAEVSDKRVTVTVPLTEVMEGKAQIDGSLSFKKR
ncbi:MAG: hypothetical protein HRU40_06870 [Saprospiraceae bacterium]|nr:hypothetical protein [Saprospiraceae bacterium]